MSNSKDYVTLRDLEERLSKIPTRWEVRFLIVVGIIGAQVLPVTEVAQAAIRLF